MKTSAESPSPGRALCGAISLAVAPAALLAAGRLPSEPEPKPTRLSAAGAARRHLRSACRRKEQTVFVAWLMLAAGGPAHAQTNLLLNGSFELPSIGAGSVQAGNPTDWTFSGSAGYLVSNGGNANLPAASDGTQLYYFFGGTLSQTSIDLTAGQSYQLMFDLTKYATLSSGTVNAALTNGADAPSRSFSVTTNGWTGESWDFTAANTGAYVLSLAAGAGTYPAVDQMNLAQLSPLAATPEPPEYALVMGLAGLGAAAWQRWNRWTRRRQRELF